MFLAQNSDRHVQISRYKIAGFRQTCSRPSTQVREIMPRNTHATPGSYPSDDESSNHSGESGRLPRSRADEDHVAGMPRRAHSGTPSDSSTDTESENSEAPRGRAAERRDGQRLDSFPVGSLRLRPRRMPGLGRAQMRIDPPREFPWSGCSLKYFFFFWTSQLTRDKKGCEIRIS